MAEIVNLRQARRARDRAEAKVAAVANRAEHGRTKREKAAARADRQAIDRTLDGAKRERPEG